MTKKLPLRLLFLFSLPVHSNIKTPTPEDSPARASSTAGTSTSGMQNKPALLRLNSVLLSLKKAVKTWPTDQESHECELRYGLGNRSGEQKSSTRQFLLKLVRPSIDYVWAENISQSDSTQIKAWQSSELPHWCFWLETTPPLENNVFLFFSWWKFFCHVDVIYILNNCKLRFGEGCQQFSWL